MSLSIRYLLFLCVLTYFVLKYANGDYHDAVLCFLGCCNQSLFVFSLHLPPVPHLADPAIDKLLLQKRTCPSWAEEKGFIPSQTDPKAPHVHQNVMEMNTKRNNITSVRIYTEKQAYATGEDITFLAITEEPDPLEFHWRLGDQTAVRTPSRTFIKKYLQPNRYHITVSVSSRHESVSSDVYTVVIQRAVHLNRLLYTRSVLLNTSVPFSCRVNAGTGITYLWNFGDGTQRVGQNTEHHVYNRTGEFVVEVTVSNLVSSGSLKGHVFVVLEPCQPPPVKNMGPSKIQIWRYQPVTLGVTYEGQIQCNIYKGLQYSWTLYGLTRLPLLFRSIKTNQQHLELPEYFLHYGEYKVVAKVQVIGSIVYSNYTVLLEVLPSAPVSIITGGTNVIINRHNNFSITVDGRRSYDPDFPDNIMSYSWKCRPVNMDETSCFSKHVPASSPLLMFPASALNSICDLFKLTLTVQSGDRSTSSEMFITVRSKPTSIIHVYCEECRGNSVNWNERISVTAACESCAIDVTYSWKLYLVNSSSKSIPVVPFCSSLDISLPSKLEEDILFFQQPVTSASPSIPNQNNSSSGSGISTQSLEHHNPSVLDLLYETSGSSAEMGSGDVNEVDFDLFHLPAATKDKKPQAKDFAAESPDEHRYLDYEELYSGIEEADSGISVGRPTGPHDLDDVISYSSKYDGDNLVGPGSPGHVVTEKTLLDLHRELIQPALFESFTSTGISSPVITFKPMMLKPKSLYLLEVSASSEQVLQGKTQFFFSTHPAPEGILCHVQPSSGFELYTHFSVFCTSGKEDLLYEYSFSVGNSREKLLYKGRDYQHYFYLASGDPYDDYKVTIYIKISNRFGASTKPCPVNVKVWPNFNPVQEMFTYSLSNLTNLLQMKNTQEIINYIFVMTATLNRLSLDQESLVKLTQTRAALISVICQLNATSQELLFDILHTLAELLKVSNQVMLDSAVLVTKYFQNLTSLDEPNLLDVRVLNDFIRILSYILEPQIPSSRLTLDVLHITTDSVLMYLLSSREHQFSVNTTFIKLMAWQSCDFQITVKKVDLTTFYLPHLPIMEHKGGNCDEKSCLITHIISYRQNPYHWARTPQQVNGHVADVKLFNCSTRREIKMRHLSTPLIIEFPKKEETNKSTGIEFTLSRSKVNTHQFNITAELLKKAVQIRVEFRRPSRRTFPILVLFRIKQRPTPTFYNVRKVYHWKGQAVQIFLPPSSLKDAGMAYLMLLNADYNKSAKNKYIADKVGYTLSIDSSQCLVWDGVKDWRSDECSVLKSFTSNKVNCSYKQLSSFTVAHQMIQSIPSVSDITEYISNRDNPMVCIVLVVLVSLYAVLLVFCNHADAQLEKNSGTFLLPDNNPSDHFLYAVTIDTDIRSRARMTAKVYIVLHGENGVSQTRELSNPDHTLFTCNSRATFILSSARSLGQIWQVHVWHDGGGMSPSWFLNHIIVKDIIDGSSWTFLAHCWLALEEGDGQVERKLLALHRQLTFTELLYVNFTECLEDFHPWLSVYTRPSYSTHTHAQRLSVCFLLLQAYMCANCILIYFQEDQYWLELGLIGVSLHSVWTGLCALTLLPLASFVSFLFHISKSNKNGSHSGYQYKVRMPYIFSVNDDWDTLQCRDNLSELNVSWNRVSPGGIKCQDLKACHLESIACSKQRESLVLQKPTDSISCIEIIEENIPDDNDKSQSEQFKKTRANFQASPLSVKNGVSRRSRTMQAVCYYGTWTLWLCLSITCVIIAGILGLKFSSTKCLLWIHSVCFSLLFCAFVAHPAMIFIVAMFLTVRHGDQGYFCQTSAIDEPVIELLRNNGQNGACVKKQSLYNSSHHTEEFSVDFEKVLATRQRARYLRLARPPTSAELQTVRSQIKKRTHLHKTIREMVLYLFASSVVGFLAYGKSSNDKFHLDQAVRSRFAGSPSVQKLDDWWNWTTNTVLHELYLNSHDYSGLEDNVKNLSLIGEPVIMKMEGTPNTLCQSRASGFSVSTEPHRCGKVSCYAEAEFNIPLGKNRSEASSKLKKLWTSGWTGRTTRAVMLQFTLYSPVYNLFTTVTILGEMSCTGGVLSSVFISSIRLYHSVSALDYWTTTGELFLLLLTLLQLYFKIYVIVQKGQRYWTDLWNWIEVIIVLLSLLRFICSVHHFTLIADTVEHLQRDDFKTFVDLSPAAFCEQRIRFLYGLLMFILLIKSCSLLRLNEAMTTALSTVLVLFSSLLWPLIIGMIFVFAFSSLGNLVILPKSVYSVTIHGFGIGKPGDLHKNQASWMLCCYGAFICIVSFAVKAMVTLSVLCSVMKSAKHKRRKHLPTVSDLCTYIWDVALSLVGKDRQKWTVHTNINNFVLEEFEDLVDELLLKLNVISSSDEDQDNYEHQIPLHSAYDFCSEIGGENRMKEMEIMPSMCCDFLYPDEETNFRSLLEFGPQEHFRESGETIRDSAIYTDRKAQLRTSISHVKTLKDSGTSLYIHRTVRAHIEGSEMLKSNRLQSFKITRESNNFEYRIQNKAFTSQLSMGFSSPTEMLTNHPSCRKSFSHKLGLYESHIEKQDNRAEGEVVNIPGQCC